MVLTIGQKSKVDDISAVVCKYFKVREIDILGSNRKEKVFNAKTFLWYILHYELRLSANTIAIIYMKDKRGIFRGISKIKNGISSQPYYKLIYEDLMKKVEPLLPEDIERFLKDG